MTLVGYDLLLVEALRRRMRSVVDDLGLIRSDDPAARAATSAAATARSLLESTWLPALADVLITDPLGGHVGSWAPTEGPTLIEAGATCSLPDEMVVRRLDELAEARATLVAVHGTGVGGIDHIDDPDAAAELVAIDARIASTIRAYLAGLPRRPDHRGDAPPVPTVLLDATPLAAALALRHIHDELDPLTLAAISVLIVRRWHEDADHRTGWLDAQLIGPNTADILFPLLADHPEAAAWYLRRARPDEVLDSTESFAPVAELLAVGTSPEVMDESTAGSVLVPLVRWARANDPLWPADDPLHDAPRAFATVLAPWLPALGPRADEFGWDDEEGGETVSWMLDHPGAADALVVALASWKGRIADTAFLGDDGRIDGRQLDDLARTLDLLENALHDAAVDDIERQALVVDLAFTAAGAIAGAVVPGGPIVGAVADLGIAAATPLARSTLDRLGVVPSTDRRLDEADRALASATTTTLVIAVTTTVATSIERGELPSDALDGLDLDDVDLDDPDEVRRRLIDYVDGLAPVADPATTNALHAVIGAFDGVRSIG